MKITPLVKLCILAAVGCGLYALWHRGVPRHQEQPKALGETEVAVHVGKISLATLRHGVTAYGTVEPKPGAADKAPASAQIKSPAAAIVSDVNCFEGQQVEKGQTLFTLEVGQTVEIVPQQAEVHDTSATAETAVPSPAPVTLTGTVTLVEDRVDPKTDMGPVDISVPAEAGLRPGQFVRVRIITEERRDCLTVPSRSIVKNQSGEWVIYLVSGKQAIQQPVKVGFREGDTVQVQSLVLQPGDKVVTTGAYGLPGKTKIRILSE